MGGGGKGLRYWTLYTKELFVYKSSRTQRRGQKSEKLSYVLPECMTFYISTSTVHGTKVIRGLRRPESKLFLKPISLKKRFFEELPLNRYKLFFNLWFSLSLERLIIKEEWCWSWREIPDAQKHDNTIKITTSIMLS